VTDKKFPGNPTKSYRTRDPVRIVGELVDWVGHSPEKVKARSDRLDELLRTGTADIDDCERPDAVGEEIRWQLRSMSAQTRAALRQLPPVGENRSGPLGPGPLASGALGGIIRELQRGLKNAKH
jgi:hypothetical protein